MGRTAIRQSSDQIKVGPIIFWVSFATFRPKQNRPNNVFWTSTAIKHNPDQSKVGLITFWASAAIKAKFRPKQSRPNNLLGQRYYRAQFRPSKGGPILFWARAAIRQSSDQSKIGPIIFWASAAIRRVRKNPECEYFNISLALTSKTANREFRYSLRKHSIFL